jgi:hypothetical protein
MFRNTCPAARGRYSQAGTKLTVQTPQPIGESASKLATEMSAP